MRIIKEKTVHQLTFMPALFPVNCYLVEEEDSLTLVDAAVPFSWKGILQASKGIGKPITRIVLTHAHEDHVGALDKLKEMLLNATVYISHRDAKLLKGDCSLDKEEENLPIKGGVPKNIKTKPDVLLKDGDKVGSLLAISCPGHTPGSMCYLDTRSNILIVGDALQTRGGAAVAGQIRIMFPFPAMATWNKKLAIESALKIKELKPWLIAAGHGNMMKEPEKVLNRIINQ